MRGFTLIELLIIIGLISILVLIGIPAFRAYQPGLRLSGAVRNLVTDLRYAQQLAVTEQVEYGVWFSTTTEHKYQIIRHQDAAATTIKEVILEEKEIYIQELGPFTNNEVRFNPYGAVINSESGPIILRNVKNATTTIDVRPSGFVRIIK